MTATTVNIADSRASADPAAVLATYSLGSCIAVCVYDAAVRVGGLLHFQLPAASLDSHKAAQNPLMFGDTGFEHLLKQVLTLGAQKRRLKVKLAGGAQILDDGGFFNIGRRNHAAIRKILWQEGMFIDGEDVGGAAPRHLYLAIADGSVTTRSGQVVRKL